ncbi:hypothetical protein CSOJ01_08306 [Colletotrichum sojae]|uniref:Uncharacterized protein n=1 Tax=Colletotrichum sojae TaxID=2175907 RepID=A0A8H6J6L4_9PEZI|nr:hypothetical protein CSOJ01_08306 [Colletotrichum sojae]
MLRRRRSSDVLQRDRSRLAAQQDKVEQNNGEYPLLSKFHRRILLVDFDPDRKPDTIISVLDAIQPLAQLLFDVSQMEGVECNRTGQRPYTLMCHTAHRHLSGCCDSAASQPDRDGTLLSADPEGRGLEWPEEKKLWLRRNATYMQESAAFALWPVPDGTVACGGRRGRNEQQCTKAHEFNDKRAISASCPVD